MGIQVEEEVNVAAEVEERRDSLKLRVKLLLARLLLALTVRSVVVFVVVLLKLRSRSEYSGGYKASSSIERSK